MKHKSKEYMAHIRKMRKPRKEWKTTHKTHKCFLDNRINEVRELRALGHSKPRLAKYFGMSISGFYYYCARRSIA